MTEPNPTDVKRFLVATLAELLAAQGRAVNPDEITADRDLFLSGLIDSLGFLELASALSDYCGFELDFESLDPEEMTVVGPLCDFVAAQVAARQPEA